MLIEKRKQLLLGINYNQQYDVSDVLIVYRNDNLVCVYVLNVYIQNQSCVLDGYVIVYKNCSYKSTGLMSLPWQPFIGLTRLCMYNASRASLERSSLTTPRIDQIKFRWLGCCVMCRNTKELGDLLCSIILVLIQRLDCPTYSELQNFGYGQHPKTIR